MGGTQKEETQNSCLYTPDCDAEFGLGRNSWLEQPIDLSQFFESDQPMGVELTPAEPIIDNHDQPISMEVPVSEPIRFGEPFSTEPIAGGVEAAGDDYVNLPNMTVEIPGFGSLVVEPAAPFTQAGPAPAEVFHGMESDDSLINNDVILSSTAAPVRPQNPMAARIQAPTEPLRRVSHDHAYARSSDEEVLREFFTEMKGLDLPSPEVRLEVPRVPVQQPQPQPVKSMVPPAPQAVVFLDLNQVIAQLPAGIIKSEGGCKPSITVESISVVHQQADSKETILSEGVTKGPAPSLVTPTSVAGPSGVQDQYAMKYLRRRQQNNVACKKSRQARKQKFEELAEERKVLEARNRSLRFEIERLDGLTRELRQKLLHQLG